MKKIELTLLIIFIIIMIYMSSKILLLYCSKSALKTFDIRNQFVEKRGNPPYSLALGKDLLLHLKVFFWVPIQSKHYTPFTKENIKTFVFGHGTIEKWGVKETGETLVSEKLIYLYVPKTFALIHGKDFYNLVHVYYN